MFFFEKKNQKTFGHWRTPLERLSATCKSFLLLFFKKEALPSPQGICTLIPKPGA
jgi:hypothetical protein